MENELCELSLLEKPARRLPHLFSFRLSVKYAALCQDALRIVPLTLHHQPTVNPSQLFELLGFHRSRLDSSAVQTSFDTSSLLAVKPPDALGTWRLVLDERFCDMLPSVSCHRLPCWSSCIPKHTHEHGKSISLPMIILRGPPERLRGLNSSCMHPRRPRPLARAIQATSRDPSRLQLCRFTTRNFESHRIIDL